MYSSQAPGKVEFLKDKKNQDISTEKLSINKQISNGNAQSLFF